jgi:hypothetical protein
MCYYFFFGFGVTSPFMLNTTFLLALLFTVMVFLKGPGRPAGL